MTTDFNLLEQRAAMFVEQGASSQALKIYLYMADGDPSLDAGYLGFKIGECYERLGDRHAADSRPGNVYLSARVGVMRWRLNT